MSKPPSDATVAFVEDVEESGVPKLTAYWDGYRAWTIGFGHTGPDIVKGLTCTRAQADEWLAEDLQKSADNVDAKVTVPINDNQRTVLISFDFNEGDGALDGSTLLKRLNSGDYAGVVTELARWVYAADTSGKMQYSAGLAARRTREAALFQTADSIIHAPAPVNYDPPFPDAPPVVAPPVKQDPDNPVPPQPPLWSSTTIISAVGTVLGAGGAGWLGQINNLYALGAIVVVAIFAYAIISRRITQRKVSGV